MSDVHTVGSVAPAEPTGYSRWLRLLLVRRPSPELPGWYSFLVTGLVVVGSALIVTTGSIHLHLWLIGYRHVPRLGPLFLAQAITGIVGGPLLALSRWLFAVLAGAGYMAASAVGLILSATVGFVGIHDGLNVPWAMTSLIVELIGFVLLAASTGLLLYRR